MTDDIFAGEPSEYVPLTDEEIAELEAQMCTRCGEGSWRDGVCWLCGQLRSQRERAVMRIGGGVE